MGDTEAGPASGKTKYGRVPLWLYEAGVSLQAVATYGWLIGKYGHFDRISPSYATLAKELGVSRGSTIAYVKELQTVGAIRIVQSGAQGRQSNQFAIAFDAPFAPESTGQNADQSAGRPVSQLDSTGQPADPGGQPAVQEEDSSFQTKKTLSSRLPQQATEPPAAPEREINEDEQMVLAAYTAALGRKPTTAVAQKICDQAAKLIADGLPAWWIADRARELPQFGTDLAKHCEMSSVPVETVRPADEAPPCTAHSKFDRMIPDPRTGDLVNCPDCHPDELARLRRQGAA